MSWFKRLWKSDVSATAKDGAEIAKPSQAPPESLKSLLDKWSSQAETYSQLALALLAPLHHKLGAIVTAAYKDKKEVKVLDVAAGPGEPALSIAKALPSAQITSTDLAPDSVVAGKARAAAAGVSDRVKFETASADNLSVYPDSSFDIVTCSMGLAMVPQWEKALKEFNRVLKRGGTLLLAVHGPQANFDSARLLVEVAKELKFPELPDPFKFSEPSVLEKALQPLGFAFRVQEFSFPMNISSVATMGAIVFGGLIRKLESQGKADVCEKAEEALTRLAKEQKFLKKDGSLELPNNQALIVTATKIM